MIPVTPKSFPNVTDQTFAPHQVKLKRWLGARTLTSVVWSASPSGPAFSLQDITIDTNTTAKVWIKSFSANTDYMLSGLVTASDNEIEEFRVRIKCLAADETE